MGFSSDQYVQHISSLSALLKAEKQTKYFETTSLVDRYLAIYLEELNKPCKHDYFRNFLQRIEEVDDSLQWVTDFYQTPCKCCGMLPTLKEVVEMIVLLCVYVWGLHLFKHYHSSPSRIEWKKPIRTCSPSSLSPAAKSASTPS